MDDIKEFVSMCKDVGLTGPNLIAAAVILWFAIKQAPDIIKAHLAHLASTKVTQEKQAATQEQQTAILARLEGTVTSKFGYHGQAITHTANGLIAHVDGKPDEAKQLAQKAREAVQQ